ncbi:MAG: glycosyltransferase family 4 protein [Candidatus Nitrospinota bacterium M3_3B_026]
MDKTAARAGARPASHAASGDPAAWLDDFARQHGRPPRILHIGNICNNAYHNAKLLNKAGADCDVINHDYYHIMGWPEWDDALFSGDFDDQFWPDWRRVKVRDFTRPRWFAQGTQKTCLAYMLARRRGRRFAAWFYWHMLNAERWYYCSGTSKRWRRRLQPLRPALRYIRRRLARARDVAKNIMLKMRGQKFWNRLTEWIGPGSASSANPAPGATQVAAGKRPADRCRELVEEFARRFPGRPDRLSYNELLAHYPQVEWWGALFEHYDIIHAYATMPILPLLAGKRPYIAYEHGTIRDIPFQDDEQGRKTALAYAMADAVYLTNADSIGKAEALGVSRDRMIFGLHGFDGAVIERKLQSASSVTRMEARFGFDDAATVFLAPARHHWRDGYDTWLKGNDKIIRAMRMAADETSKRFAVVFVAWGREIELSRELIRSLDLERYVTWVEPLPKDRLIKSFSQVDCVIDQFVCPCMGGVAIDALMAGAPVITRLDEAAMNEFYGSQPPLFNCADDRQIADAMIRVIENPSLRGEMAERAKKWMARHHGNAAVVATNLAAYRIAWEGVERASGVPT